MKSTGVDKALKTLELFIDRQAEQEITKDEVQRVLVPVLDSIKEKELKRVYESNNRDILLSYLYELITAETANGKLTVVVIEKKDEEDNNHILSYRGEH